MEWYVYALLGSFMWSLVLVLEKKILCKEHSIEYACTRTFLNAVLVFFFLPFINIQIDFVTFAMIYAASLFATIGIYYRVKAVKHMDISVAVPLFNFNPVFVLILGFVFLKETISYTQLSGIFVIILGAYLMEADGSWKNLAKPIKSIWESKYIHYIFLAMFLFAIEAVVDKYVVSYKISVLPFMFYFWIFIFFNMMLISIFKYDGINQVKKGLKDDGYLILLVSVLSLLAGFSFLKAMSLGLVTLVITIKRVSTIFTTILGGEFFHEKHLLVRGLSSLIMVFGVYLVLV